MRPGLHLLIHLIVTYARLLRPGGVSALIAENLALRQQLIVMNRGRSRAGACNVHYADRSKTLSKDCCCCSSIDADQSAQKTRHP